MRTTAHNKVNFVISIATIVIALLLITGCSSARYLLAGLRSTDNFLVSEDDIRVLFEPGAEEHAKKVVSFLPSAIQQVEERQYSHFIEPIRIYICVSRESFKKYFGADRRAGVTTKVFLSPRAFEGGDDIAKKYLIHELAHLHLRQRIGSYKMRRLPMWFKEGLATYVSDGAGGNLVSHDQAVEAIRGGKHFIPNKVGGLFFQKTPSVFGLKPHMFYHQSMLFINYLVALDETCFKKVLLSVENGEQFCTTLQKEYKKSLEELWSGFLQNIRNKG